MKNKKVRLIVLAVIGFAAGFVIAKAIEGTQPKSQALVIEKDLTTTADSKVVVNEKDLTNKPNSKVVANEKDLTNKPNSKDVVNVDESERVTVDRKSGKRVRPVSSSRSPK